MAGRGGFPLWLPAVGVAMVFWCVQARHPAVLAPPRPFINTLPHAAEFSAAVLAGIASSAKNGRLLGFLVGIDLVDQLP